MAAAKVTVCPAELPKPHESIEVEVAIIGAGICGLLGAKHCAKRGLPFIVLERGEELGGVWHTLANNHSCLQAYESSYRWDPLYRLERDEFTKPSGLRVLHNLRKYAFDHSLDRFTRLRTEVLTVRQLPCGSFLTVCKHLGTGHVTHIRSAFLLVTPGILASQFTAEERGVEGVHSFKGVFTYAGRKDGVDCAAGPADVEGKEVVIMGTGAFALEAAEVAARRGAKHVTLISRPRTRWVIPFSRQFTCTLLSNPMPLVPWCLKARITQWWLRKFWFEPAGLGHMVPTGPLQEQDWGGQCSDGLFRLAAGGRLSVVVDRVERLEGYDVVLEKGGRRRADMFVCAAGCRYNLQPSFLSELGVGFHTLHSHCFMGPNPRIGTASDFVFAYVPLGPQKQLEMFFHAVDLIRQGREEELLKAMQPTDLGAVSGASTHIGGRMASHHTWFAYRHWWSTQSIASEERLDSYLSIMSAGKPAGTRAIMRLVYEASRYLTTAGLLFKSLKELRRYPVFGKEGGQDHWQPRPALVRCGK
ncbi:hypothetical protein ABPG75_012207 [Micractinium tetrahymenae]